MESEICLRESTWSGIGERTCLNGLGMEFQCCVLQGIISSVDLEPATLICHSKKTFIFKQYQCEKQYIKYHFGGILL
jgi:hypothetical protein